MWRKNLSVGGRLPGSNRRVERPVYAGSVMQERAAAHQQAGIDELDTLVRSGYTWNVA